MKVFVGKCVSGKSRVQNVSCTRGKALDLVVKFCNHADRTGDDEIFCNAKEKKGNFMW